jgi:hypothetical protein
MKDLNETIRNVVFNEAKFINDKTTGTFVIRITSFHDADWSKEKIYLRDAAKSSINTAGSKGKAKQFADKISAAKFASSAFAKEAKRNAANDVDYGPARWKVEPA